MSRILGSESTSKGIGHLLMESRLCVPDYQRPYSWKKQQVDDLLQDLRRAIDNDRPFYFLGSIVGYEKANGDMEIVDGQQRLATVTILLAAFRDRLLKLVDNDAAGRLEQESLFKTQGFANKNTSPRLTLSESDNEFFRKRILSRPDSPDRNVDAPRASHRKIAQAAKDCSMTAKVTAKRGKHSGPLRKPAKRKRNAE